MFRRRRPAWLLALIAGVACSSQAPEPVPTSEEQKALYVMGAQLAERLDFLELTPDELEYVVLGLRDEVLQNEAKVREEETANLQTFVLRRRERRATREKEASKSFLEAEAAVEGAVTYDSGLVLLIKEEGTGAKPLATSTVRVHYHGTLRDGTVFDSSVDRKAPATFPLNRVILCWQEAIAELKVGSKARIVCPADIAYGDRGSPPTIKPGAALAFDVELLEIVEKGSEG